MMMFVRVIVASMPAMYVLLAVHSTVVRAVDSYSCC